MKYRYYLLSLILLAGTIFAWVTVFNDFITFYKVSKTNNLAMPSFMGIGYSPMPRKINSNN